MSTPTHSPKDAPAISKHAITDRIFISRVIRRLIITSVMVMISNKITVRITDVYKSNMIIHFLILIHSLQFLFQVLQMVQCMVRLRQFSYPLLTVKNTFYYCKYCNPRQRK